MCGPQLGMQIKPLLVVPFTQPVLLGLRYMFLAAQMARKYSMTCIASTLVDKIYLYWLFVHDRYFHHYTETNAWEEIIRDADAECWPPPCFGHSCVCVSKEVCGIDAIVSFGGMTRKQSSYIPSNELWLFGIGKHSVGCCWLVGCLWWLVVGG